jgi:hypothetical protein
MFFPAAAVIRLKCPSHLNIVLETKRQMVPTLPMTINFALLRLSYESLPLPRLALQLAIFALF